MTNKKTQRVIVLDQVSSISVQFEAGGGGVGGLDAR